jgi:phosphinothricin acetyltransferase
VEDSVYLAPGATGRGLGRQLLAELLARAGQAGARQMVAVIADAGADSDASVALHRAFGFCHVGRLTGVGRKHGRWIDTLLMQRGLTD